jgi:predicted GNAT family N-acyltransferase
MSTRPRGWVENWTPRAATQQLIEQVQEILAQYADQLPLTIRQIFYRLVARFGFEKTERAYKNRLVEHLNMARRARVIPMHAIRDDGFTIAGRRL